MKAICIDNKIWNRATFNQLEEGEEYQVSNFKDIEFQTREGKKKITKKFEMVEVTFNEATRQRFEKERFKITEVKEEPKEEFDDDLPF